MTQDLSKDYFNKGNTCQKEGKINKAVQYYLDAIRINPHDQKPYKKLERIQKLNPKQTHSVVNSYQEIIEQYRNHELPLALYTKLCTLLTRLGQFDEVIKYNRIVCSRITLEKSPNFYEQFLNNERSGKPNFLVIGAAKAGTTSLFQYLVQHPQILSPTKKEIRFFNKAERLQRGLDWYSSHFPYIPEQANYLTGEATPGYITADIQDQVYKLFPTIKLIAILRNPVERAISHYHHRVKHRWESRSFEEAMKSELELIKDVKDFSTLEDVCRQTKSVYLLGGLYYYSLKRWMTVFSREQFLIIDNKKLFTNPDQTMEKVYSFLDLPHLINPSYIEYNVGSYKKKSVDDSIYQSLTDFFKPHNKFLEVDLEIQL
jgi:tetratricopeptide (TPR) repeat protein